MQQLIADTVAAMQVGRHAEALRLSRELVAAMPADEGALSLLAVSEQNAGNLTAARDILLDLTRRHPQTWQHWNNLGNVQRLLGDTAAAGEAYARALALNSGSVRLQANLGLLHLNAGAFARAKEHLCTAATMPGVEPGMLIWAAVACYACTDDEAARMLVKDWPRWPRQSDEAMLELGWLLFQLGDVAGADSILAAEFHDDAFRLRALARRVLVLERLNRTEEAITLAQSLPAADRIADAQARMEALQALAQIAMRRDDHVAAREYYMTALALDVDRRYREPLYFGLAAACDRIGDVTATMSALEHAHAQSSDRRADPARFAGTGLLALAEPDREYSGPADWSADRSASADDRAASIPVFVVGFPRSGTTLVEQMLAAHDDFVSVDEKPMLQRAIERMRSLGFTYPADLATLSVSDRDALAKAYWQEADKHVQRRSGQRLVDKHPLNFIALPMIRRLFPDAPMIFCARHPCDAILSCHMQQFRDPRLAVLCGSIERLAREYVRLNRRWLHDSRLFPDNVLVCRYEDLVVDTDAELRRVGAFLGVDDVSAMHGFREHAHARGFIGTPSYSQVVQPLSSDAVGRWQRYRDHFESVLPTLAPIMEHWGYET